MTRKRKHIPMTDKLAAALACLLPATERDLLRAAKARPAAVLKRFSFDHIVLHAWGGSDGWWNLNPMLREAHREKSRVDTGRAAKAHRLDAKWEPFAKAMKTGRKLAPRGRGGQPWTRWPAPRNLGRRRKS